MTLFTRDAKHVIRLAIPIRRSRICHRFEIRSVALETTRQHWTTEVYNSIAVTRTVHPIAERRPIRNRKLEQLIVVPVKIRLPFAS